ncbi:DUF2510 domain-containing protein [Microbacterium jejuense]|uniref:DUF2510 domain-containing protein n=1 Tax=Microbacterium jejuense TaxID=1263637 RepID=UPI003383EE10
MSETTTAGAPAGWYPGGCGGRERYWDGVRWTGMVRDAGSGAVPCRSPQAGTVTASAAGSHVEQPIKRPWYSDH